MESLVERPQLVFDDSCPLCKVYTGAFEHLGWADRQSFSTCADLGLLDLDRARHEIPMFDPVSGEVLYGLDSLFTVLEAQLPALQPALRSELARRGLTPLYKFISYNRREIAGCPPPERGFDCAPDFHVGWKMAYVAAVAGVVGASAAGSAAATAAVATGSAVGIAEFGPEMSTSTPEGRVAMVANGLTAVGVGAVLARLIGGPIGALVGAGAGLHQLFRRRWVA